jgi:hypothetical protein
VDGGIPGPIESLVLTSGSFPPGLTYNPFTGVLSGTPTTLGTFTGAMTPSSEFQAGSPQAFSITVAGAGAGGGGGGGGGSSPPPPVAGQSVNAQVVSGAVTLQCPGQPPAQLSNQQVQVGCKIDATIGRVSVTSADGKGGTQTADFYEGAFTVGYANGTVPAKLSAAAKKKKKKKGKPKTVKALITVLTLVGPDPSGCGRKKAKPLIAAAAKPGRRLWGKGKGRFRTRGAHSAATVRGTNWLTEERCNGTFTQVAEGIVSVDDLTLKKTVSVKAVHSYLAPAKKSKKKRHK